MDRLHAELQRLFLPANAQDSPAASGPSGRSDLVTGQGCVRALVLCVTRPAAWESLGKVWRGVQTELELPAPAIAVSGGDACQLWFSLITPVSVAEACAFLGSLQRRYLTDLAALRMSASPTLSGSDAAWHFSHALPPLEVEPGRWSAFVAADLAGLFDDEAWLDMPPPADAQADLLSRVRSTKADDWQRALDRLGQGSDADARTAMTPAAASGPSGTGPAGPDPKDFLLQVMNDPAIDLQHRIDAARALLPYYWRPA